MSSFINDSVAWRDTSPGLGSGEVAEDLDGVLVAARVGIDPVVTRDRLFTSGSVGKSKILARSDRVFLGTRRSLHRSDRVFELSESSILVAISAESLVIKSSIHGRALLAA